MTEKRKHKHEEETEMENAEAVAQSTQENPIEKDNQLSAEIESLTGQLREAETKAAEYKDGWARAQADFQNYKKRIERDNELTYITMKGDIVKKILPVLDDLERALQNRPADNAWANGIELIARKLQNALESECGLGFAQIMRGQQGCRFGQEGGEFLLEPFDIGAAGAQHVGRRSIVEQGQQEMLDRHEFMTLLARLLECEIQCEFKFLAQHDGSTSTTFRAVQPRRMHRG